MWERINTVIGHFTHKRVESKFTKEIKPGYYSSIPEMVSELNSEIPAGTKTIKEIVSIFVLIMILFPTSLWWICLMDYQKNGGIRLGYANGIQREWNSALVYIHCIPVYAKYETIYSVMCLHRYHYESTSGLCKSTLTFNSSSEIEIWRENICNLWTTSVLSSEQIQHSDHINQYKEQHRWTGVMWKWEATCNTCL